MAFKIKVASSAGFCFGVRKALDRLIDIRNNSTLPVRTLGPLIHNEQVLEALKHRAVRELDESEDVTGKHVVLRAHGVTPDTRRLLREQGALVCDATCPKVGQVQAIVKKYSQRKCPVIIIGDRGHAEVDGLLGYCQTSGLVVTGPEEAALLEQGAEACVVAQTTQDPVIFDQTVKIIRTKFKVCHVHNTICDATTERQTETMALAMESDVMIVVGGKNSANTKRLADIAGKNCKAVMIQSAQDLSPNDFEGVKRVAITAGASTPAWVIREVVERIRVIGWQQYGKTASLVYQMMRLFNTFSLIWATGLGLLCYSLLLALTGVSAWPTATAVAFLVWIWRISGQRFNPGLDIGVSALLAMLPAIHVYKHTTALHTALAAVFLGVVFFNRLLLFDCLNVQADKISGHITLPSLNKKILTKLVVIVCIGLTLLAVLGLIWLTTDPVIAFLLIIPAGFTLFLSRRMKTQGWCDLYDLLYLDGPVWMTALLTMLFRIGF